MSTAPPPTMSEGAKKVQEGVKEMAAAGQTTVGKAAHDVADQAGQTAGAAQTSAQNTAEWIRDGTVNVATFIGGGAVAAKDKVVEGACAVRDFGAAGVEVTAKAVKNAAAGAEAMAHGKDKEEVKAETKK